MKGDKRMIWDTLWELALQAAAMAAVPITFDLYKGTEALKAVWKTDKGKAEILFLCVCALLCCRYLLYGYVPAQW